MGLAVAAWGREKLGSPPHTPPNTANCNSIVVDRKDCTGEEKAMSDLAYPSLIIPAANDSNGVAGAESTREASSTFSPW